MNDTSTSFCLQNNNIFKTIFRIIKSKLLIMSNHQHNHSQGHTHHAGCSHGEQHYEEPDEYFRKLAELKQKS